MFVESELWEECGKFYFRIVYVLIHKLTTPQRRYSWAYCELSARLPVGLPFLQIFVFRFLILFYFTVFYFFGSAWQIKLANISFPAHVNTVCLIVTRAADVVECGRKRSAGDEGSTRRPTDYFMSAMQLTCCSVGNLAVHNNTERK